jgi:hypothetical protein
MARMIRKPGAADRYGFLEQEQKMPAFGPDQLTHNDLETLIRYLKDDYPKGGAAEGNGTESLAARGASAIRPPAP